MLSAIEKVRRMAPLVKAQGGVIHLKKWAYDEIRRRRDTLPGVRYDDKAKRLTYDDVELSWLPPVKRPVPPVQEVL